MPNVRARQRKRTLEELLRFIESMIEQQQKKNPKKIHVRKQDVALLFSDKYGNREQKILDDYIPFQIRMGRILEDNIDANWITLPKYAKER